MIRNSSVFVREDTSETDSTAWVSTKPADPLPHPPRPHSPPPNPNWGGCAVVIYRCQRTCLSSLFTDQDECTVQNGGCDHSCFNSPAGSYHCVCNTGFYLSTDRKKCRGRFGLVKAQCYTVKRFSWNSNATQVSPEIVSCNTVGFVKHFLEDVSRNSFTKGRTVSYFKT